MDLFKMEEQLLEKKENVNLFSYWYPKISGNKFNIPDSFIIKVPNNIQELLLSFADKEYEIVYNWMKQELNKMKKNEFNHQLVFVKNGLFSNKFNANDCITFNTTPHLTMSLFNIAYAAACVGCHEGNGEFIIRERIVQSTNEIPTIYNGLPLNVEFRVFYDFDKKEVMHIHDYWDYDYVYDNLSYNDKIIFEQTRTKRERLFQENVDYVKMLVEENLKFNNEFSGEWSIDIMYLEKEKMFYLIDMAEAKKSTYYKCIKK